MNPSQKQEQAKFKASLLDFLSNTARPKPAKFQYNAFKLYKFVCRQGGFQAVSNRNQWPQIANQFAQNDVNKIKHFYFKFVYPYEQKYYFGKQGDQDYPNLIYGNPRKIVKTDPTVVHNQNSSIQQVQSQAVTSNLQDQISKNFEQQERQKKQFFLNKNKLNQTKTETKKIILGLQSFMDRKDIIYSLNLLLLYSINNHSPFLLQNNEKIFNSLSSYTQSIFPPKSERQLEDLRTITLIFRNLTMNPINLKFILGTSMFQLFVNMFNKGLDSQCSKNIVDIMTGLVKVGWDCQRIFKGLDQALLNNNIDQIQNAIQLLRGLVDQREQTLICSVASHIKTLNRVLLSNDVSIEIKEQVFQILAFVSDVSIDSKENLSKNSELIGIIMGIIQYMRNCQKLAQLSALTLNNLSTASGGKGLIKQYETQLMVIGFSDDSLAGIIATILADLTSY